MVASTLDLTTAKINASQLCEVIGVQIDTVTRLVRAGCIPKAMRGEFELISATRAYCRYLIDKAAKAKSETEYDDEVDLDKARLNKAKADMAEMEAGLRAGELVTLAHIEKIMSERLSIMRQKLLALPTRAAPLVAGEDVQAAFETITKLVHEALEDVSTNAFGAGSGHRRANGSARIVYTTAAKIDRLAVGRGKARTS